MLSPAAASDTPSSSSSSDLYSTDAAPPPPDLKLQPERNLPAPNALCHTLQAPEIEDDNDEESSFEMDLSSPSRPSTPEPLSAATATSRGTVVDSSEFQNGAKRKLSTTDSLPADVPEQQVKKRKVLPSQERSDNNVMNTAFLPPELWQRIFLHLPPAMLCRCLRVCKKFHAYLTDDVAMATGSAAVRLIRPEAIWTHSRNSFMPLLPKPLSGYSELRMLQLIGSHTCQFCARQQPVGPAVSIFEAGPGPTGVRVLWPFGVRTCGLCLKSRMIKDVEVLSNHLYKDLRYGVPHGFCSQDLNFASESVRTQVQGGIPASLRFSKIMYRPDLEALRAEEENAIALHAADEWHKGLWERGKKAIAESARWEKWELQMRPGANLANILREYDLSSFPRYVEATRNRLNGSCGTQSLTLANGTHPLPQPVHVFSTTQSIPGPTLHPHPLPLARHQGQMHQPRPFRNPQQVEEARRARRAEIERRCLLFEPPLRPNVLQHMETFQAALQITTPMTDAAWDMLKPRLLAQREAAELVEHERAHQLAALQATIPLHTSEQATSRPGKETFDREYEQAQEPFRKRLGEYANDFINGQWGGGRMIKKDNAPIFAALALSHVRRRYEEDAVLNLLPAFEPRPYKNGSKQETPPRQPFLSLDNMKWVYDNKVRPLTDVHKREHFICAGCPEEKKPKWFAFEGLIQHYGAKHTAAFSKGNIVVHWQTAEWPEIPPFHTNPGKWLKVDQRTSEHSYGRTRQPLQSSRGASPHVSEDSSTISSGGLSAYSNRPKYRFISPPHNHGSDGQAYHETSLLEAPVTLNYEARLKKFSSDARTVWDALEGVAHLEAGVRVVTAVYHASSWHHQRFLQTPALDMLTDALATDSSMRVLKNAYGLACKACVAASPNATSGLYWLRIRDAKLYNTSSLITHNKLMHIPQAQFGFSDWIMDMVELPDQEQMRTLLRTGGMDDEKLALIAAAMPSAFPSPLPKIGEVRESESDHANDSLPGRLLDRLSKKPKSSAKKGLPKPGSDGMDREESHDPLPEPTEDEYDPRRPMFVHARSGDTSDPSQFDTDARRPTTDPSASNLNLDLEALAALHSAMSRTGDGTSSKGRRSRSPSVGRPSPKLESKAPTKALVPGTTNAPDIAAILASLTGQPQILQTHMPSAADARYGTDTTVRPSYEPPYHQAQPRRLVPDRSTEAAEYIGHLSSFAPTYNGSVSDLQVALGRNGRQFGQNQILAGADSPHAARLHHALTDQQQEGREELLYRKAPIPLHLSRNDAAAVQYYPVVLPTPEYTSPGDHYERTLAEPLYVDQYGRPLERIPIYDRPMSSALPPYSGLQAQAGHKVAPMPHYQHTSDNAHSLHHGHIYWDKNGASKE